MLIDWFTIGAQALNFLILVGLLRRFLYRPILHAIAAREQLIAGELADAGAKVLVVLGEKGGKALDDLADLASDELIETLGTDAMDPAVANDVIMAARAHWFGDDDAPAGVITDAPERVQEAGHD